MPHRNDPPATGWASPAPHTPPPEPARAPTQSSQMELTLPHVPLPKLTATKLRTDDIRRIARNWISEWAVEEKCCASISLGLPEWDDRLALWRVALLTDDDRSATVGEVQIDDRGAIRRMPELKLVAERVHSAAAGRSNNKRHRSPAAKSRIYFPPTPNKVVLGDCRAVLAEFPPDSAQLVITSPPYYNAKPEYAEYLDYRAYLDFLGECFAACHQVLAEGRFLVVNISPVLVRRTSRNVASKRLPIPFDLHPILDSIGFEFIDDIIWRKPEGAGWHLGRGRRFAADRQPLQYKPVTVTEYILIYRKKTERLIDWNLRNHPDPDAVTGSLILGEYDRTNVWDITPSSRKSHPAVFPDELVSRVIRYYSFAGDCVLDPFAGAGTVGRVASAMGRRFILIDNQLAYFEAMRRELAQAALGTRVDFDDLQYRQSLHTDEQAAHL